MASTATPPAPPAARPRSRAQKRGRGSGTTAAPLPQREIIALPETGTWLDVCCAHARWHLAHPERDRLPRTDTIAAAIAARTYLRGLAWCPGHGRERSAVVRTSLHQLITGLGRIWGWDLSAYPPRMAGRERDVVDRHAKGLHRRLRPLIEGGLIEHRVLQDLELEDRGTELVLLPIPAWTQEELAIGRTLRQQLAAALKRPESRASVLIAQMDAHKAGGAERGRERAQAAQKARALAALPRAHDDVDDFADFPTFEIPIPLSANPASRAVPFSAQTQSLGIDKSSRGEEQQQPMTRGNAWLQPIVHPALSGLSRQPLGEDRGSVPVVASPVSSVLLRSSREVEAWSGDPSTTPGARTLAEAFHHAKHGRRGVLEPMMLVGRTAQAGLVALAERAQAEADRGAHLNPLGELFLARVHRYPHPHAALRSLQSEIRRARALRELQQPVTGSARVRAWNRVKHHAPDWLYVDAKDGEPLAIHYRETGGQTRLAVRRPLSPTDLLNRNAQSALEAAMLLLEGRHHAQIELETPDGQLAGRFATRRGRHSLMADGAHIHIPGHHPVVGW